jgi:epoxyqueuosine reductase
MAPPVLDVDTAAVDSALDARVRARAMELGFTRVGVASVTELEPEAAALRAWLAAGRHGAMQYMADTAAARADVRDAGMLPSARSVVVVAASYRRNEEPEALAPGRVARYALARDYHATLGKRMQRLAKVLRREGHAARAGVDLLPVLERAWAQRAGLGFIGKNCCLIVPGLGSHVLLGSIVTSARLVADAPMRERCGACRACLDACPTRAFVAERSLDARRCIAYLTIEQPHAIEPALRADMGAWTFGCDACQDICPFNRTRPLPEDQTRLFTPDARLAGTGLEDLLAMPQEAVAALTGGTPLSRPGPAALLRNAAVTMGNVGSRKHLPLLQGLAARESDPVVREAAHWAQAQIEAREPLRTADSSE